MRIINTIISSSYPGSDKERHYETHCGGLIKLIWHGGVGLCMLTKRLEQGQFVSPSTTTTGRVTLSSRSWRPCSAGASGGRPYPDAGRNWLDKYADRKQVLAPARRHRPSWPSADRS